MKSSDEVPHEKHNRIAFELGQRILTEFPETDTRLLMLETLVQGVIALMTKDEEKRRKIAEIVHDGVLTRLGEQK